MGFDVLSSTCFFLVQTVSFLSHIARYAPSKTNTLISKISGVSNKAN